MEVILVIMLLIATTAAMVWAITKLIEKICNIITIYRFNKHPDQAHQKHGIVYNKKEKKIEADQSPITPF